MDKRVLLFCCLFILQHAVGVEVETLAKDSKALEKLFKCFLETGPCSKEEDFYRVNIPEVVQNNCKKCSTETREFFTKMVRVMVQQHPDVWKKLTDKYDPDGKNEKNVLKFVGLGS